MKLLKIYIAFLLLIGFAILGCHREGEITQKQLRSSVLIFKEKFAKAEEIEVFIHNDIIPGEDFKEIRRYTLTIDQMAKLNSKIDFVLRNKLSYFGPMAIVFPYDMTIALKSSNKNTELITITENKRRITAHTSNPDPAPQELARTLHDFFFE